MNPEDEIFDELSKQTNPDRQAATANDAAEKIREVKRELNSEAVVLVKTQMRIAVKTHKARQKADRIEERALSEIE